MLNGHAKTPIAGSKNKNKIYGRSGITNKNSLLASFYRHFSFRFSYFQPFPTHSLKLNTIIFTTTNVATTSSSSYVERIQPFIPNSSSFSRCVRVSFVFSDLMSANLSLSSLNSAIAILRWFWASFNSFDKVVFRSFDSAISYKMVSLCVKTSLHAWK